MMNNIKVFDIQGRLITEQKSVKANTTSIQNLKASNQVLIVNVTTDDNQVISKKVEN
jgi:ribonucleotide monophosphatase NagD (HAD superfamily)